MEKPIDPNAFRAEAPALKENLKSFDVDQHLEARIRAVKDKFQALQISFQATLLAKKNGNQQ